MADTLDALTLPEAREAINVADGHEGEIARWVTAVTRRIDQLCGPVVARAVSEETHDGGRRHIVLNELYASEASSVVEYRHTTSTTLTAETNDTKPGAGYLLDDVGAGVTLLRRRASGTDVRFPDGRRNIVISYTAGRYATTAAVDPLFKTAVGSILRRLWSREAGAWARGGDPFAEAGTQGSMVGFFKAVDPMVHELLGDELRIPAAG